MSNILRRIKKNQLENATGSRVLTRYEDGNKEKFDLIKANCRKSNDFPENHRGNIQKQVIKFSNEQELS